ncbi:hypothetical protein EVAR_102108_1 [Eumeta japonica]|uniref:Uncharacterized protein n=1 Tax=Eumeta variegata TaxID=151549 RepID=A0A4C1TZZ9_EUMVA|nr:hypothetical protein EVAR_102108_1 [Eumeta japonica]
MADLLRWKRCTRRSVKRSSVVTARRGPALYKRDLVCPYIHICSYNDIAEVPQGFTPSPLLYSAYLPTLTITWSELRSPTHALCQSIPSRSTFAAHVYRI